MTIKVGIMGGTGFGEALSAKADGNMETVDTPYGPPSSPVLQTTFGGVPVAFISRHGPGHVFSPSRVNYRANVYALKALGCTHVIASGAVGSLQENVQPRQLVLVDQFIDRTVRRVGSFFEDDVVVHAEFAEPCCPVLRGEIMEAAKDIGATIHPKGTYVCMEGPQFSTKAESRLHRSWGADLIGMTALPEAKLCREAEMGYALVALVTDFDCWREHAAPADKGELLKEIIGNLHVATEAAILLVKAALQRIGSRPAGAMASSAHTALDLAVWSRGGKLSPELVERYGVLLKRVANQ